MTFDSVFSTALVCNDCNTLVTADTAVTLIDTDQSVCNNCADLNYQYCDSCTDFFSLEAQMHTADDTLNVCDNCLSYHYYECFECESNFSENSMASTDNGMVCENCLDEYSLCDWSQEYVRSIDLTETGRIHHYDLPNNVRNNLCCDSSNLGYIKLSVSEDVLNNYFTRCDDCNNYYLDDSMTQTSNYTNVCNHCYQDHCFTCEQCEEVYHVEHHHHDSICINCIDDDDDGEIPHIYGYHRRNAADLGFKGKPLDKDFYIGTELEVESKIRELRDSNGSKILNACGSDLILMEDGSISRDRGFEIITAPCSFEYQKLLWKKIFDLDFQGLRSWDTNDRCGMHVHVSRKFFNGGNTGLHLGKLLVLINLPENREFIVALAGRDSSRWSEFKRKKITDGNKYNSNRYEAINTTNTHTIEFRIFRGTLNKLHFFANLEFVHAVCLYTRDCSMQSLCYEKFLSWIKKQPKKYKNLIEFITSKGY